MAEIDRQLLREQQARLVRSLVDSASPPPGFDSRQLTIAAAALLQKRMRGMAKGFPMLVKTAGDRFAREFAEYARQNPLPAGGATQDGLCFARHLRQRGLLARRIYFLLRLRLAWARPG